MLHGCHNSLVCSHNVKVTCASMWFLREKVAPSVPESLLKRRKHFAAIKAVRLKTQQAEKKVGGLFSLSVFPLNGCHCMSDMPVATCWNINMSSISSLIHRAAKSPGSSSLSVLKLTTGNTGRCTDVRSAWAEWLARPATTMSQLSPNLLLS